MLNKNICINCCNKVDNIDDYISNEYAEDIAYGEWEQEDEDNWRNGWINCVLQNDLGRLRIKDDPPKYCPYKLEHIIGNQCIQLNHK